MERLSDEQLTELELMEREAIPIELTTWRPEDLEISDLQAAWSLVFDENDGALVVDGATLKACAAARNALPALLSEVREHRWLMTRADELLRENPDATLLDLLVERNAHRREADVGDRFTR